MQVKQLMQMLRKIVKCNPEASEANLVAVNSEGDITYVAFIGYDKKKKRILLEE